MKNLQIQCENFSDICVFQKLCLIEQDRLYIIISREAHFHGFKYYWGTGPQKKEKKQNNSCVPGGSVLFASQTGPYFVTYTIFLSGVPCFGLEGARITECATGLWYSFWTDGSLSHWAQNSIFDIDRRIISCKETEWHNFDCKKTSRFVMRNFNITTINVCIR